MEWRKEVSGKRVKGKGTGYRIAQLLGHLLGHVLAAIDLYYRIEKK